MYKKIIFIAIATLTLVSCKKDPKDVAPTDQLDNITYPKSLADLESFLIPGYSNFRSASLYGFKYLPAILCSDHTFTSTNLGQPLGQNGDGFLINNINVTNNTNAAIFSALYLGVANMNVFLERANYYQNTFGNKPAVDALRGQAYFLRAYYLFQLECLYGEQYIDMTKPADPDILGVTLPLEFATSVPKTNQPRSTAFEVWSQIIEDLKLSAQYLQGVTYPARQGKVTELAANALLGKAYVFTKQMDSAKIYLNKVINSSATSLMDFNQYKNAFNGNVPNEFNTESIFEVNVDRQEGNPGIVFAPYPANLQSLTTSMGEMFAPTIISAAGQDGFGPGANNMGNGYCQYFVHDKNLLRFGFKLPIYTLVANPLSVGASTAGTPSLIMDPVSKANSLAVRTDNTVDPRLYVCALQPWVDSVRQPFAASASGATPESAPEVIPVGRAYIISGNRNAYWGWSFRKYATIDNNLSAYGANDASNLYLLRLADIYLLYAEANMTSDPATALEYINKVHRRAYGGSTAFDYPNLTAATKVEDPSDPLYNNPLRYERFAELFGEGGWWFDICRWGIGAQEAAYYEYGTADYNPASPASSPVNSFISTTNWTSNGLNSQAYHFPIPNVEMQVNSAIQRNNFPY